MNRNCVAQEFADEIRPRNEALLKFQIYKTNIQLFQKTFIHLCFSIITNKMHIAKINRSTSS